MMLILEHTLIYSHTCTHECMHSHGPKVDSLILQEFHFQVLRKLQTYLQGELIYILTNIAFPLSNEFSRFVILLLKVSVFVVGTVPAFFII